MRCKVITTASCRTSAISSFARRDKLWSYQLAVVVDDADQGITHITRGIDLIDSTPRQLLLQQALQLPTPKLLPPARCTGTEWTKTEQAKPRPATTARPNG